MGVACRRERTDHDWEQYSYSYVLLNDLNVYDVYEQYEYS